MRQLCLHLKWMQRVIAVSCVLVLAACHTVPPPPASAPAPKVVQAQKHSAVKARAERFFAPSPAVERESALLSPQNVGMSSWQELASLLQCSLDYARQWYPQDRAVEHSGKLITWAEVVASLEHLQTLLPQLDQNPGLLAQEFEWIAITPDVRFTGYFTPLIEASLERRPGYEWPIYRLPDELAPQLAWCLANHDCPDGSFTPPIRPEIPFLNRAAIDLDGALQGRRLEMAWLKHSVDAYELMLEGSGMLDFGNGNRRMAQFAGFNGNPGQSMAGYLIRHGELPRNKSSMSHIKDWWDKNPAKRRKFLEAASSYVFFRYSNTTSAAQGTTGCGLTPWASMAVDPTVLPLGGILAYSLPNQPDTGGVRNGLGFAQDTGGAIRGRRVDMFTGGGEGAYRQAVGISAVGKIWLLLKR